MSKIIYGVDDKIPGESAYDRCSYKGCKNGKYRMGGRKLFLFPSHTEPERREKWLNNCGNDELRKKADSSIRRSGVCSDHFDSSCFTDGKKSSLKRNSVPRLNYPQHLNDESGKDNHRSIENKPITRCVNTKVDPTSKNGPNRVPKLFVDDDYLSDDNNGDCYNNYENLNNIQKNENNQLSDEVMFIEEDKNYFESRKWVDNAKLLILECNDEFNPVEDQSQPSFMSVSTEKQINITTPKDYAKVTTSMSTIELLRKMNEEQNKDKKIEKLIKQNMILRRELKTLKQNVRRWERRRQTKLTVKKPTLKQQKRMVLNIVNEMDISPVAKAIISLQLHTRKTPYTEEEKNLAKSFQQYSRNDIKRLRSVGCNVPSQSSIKRWISNLDESILLSTSEQDSVKNENNEPIIHSKII